MFSSFIEIPEFKKRNKINVFGRNIGRWQVQVGKELKGHISTGTVDISFLISV